MMLCSLCNCAAVHVLAYGSIDGTQQSKTCESGVVNADLLAVSGSGVAGHADVCGQA